MLAVAKTIPGCDSEAKDELTDKSLSPEQDEWKDCPPPSSDFHERVQREVAETLRFVGDSAATSTYEGFEAELVKRVFRLARLLIALFLCLASERTMVPETIIEGQARYRRQPAKSRLLGTFFGKVRYWRVYLHRVNGRGGGYHPLDLQLGLTADGFSLGLLSRAVRLATKMSFEVATRVLTSFLGWSPATKTFEQAVLGLGRYTQEWFEHAPPPEGDGDVLVIQIDGKATPTVRDEELKKRRGKRRPNPLRGSARHRGRENRARRGPKVRRKKGDKSKNGRQTTTLVMYTLQSDVVEGQPVLKGPINRRVYSSYGSKRHVFAVARREADKRGFTLESGQTIQVVTDGDEDFAAHVKEIFPTALHTLDIMHVIERLWDAGGCLFREGSEGLTEWVESQKANLYSGGIWDVIIEIEGEHDAMKPGPRRSRLDKILNYLIKRTQMMNYDELAARDLELASGAAEGAVRFVVSQRFDEGGMRWIRERAEAVLQLRCIEINGDWEPFVAFVHDKIMAQQRRMSHAERVLTNRPEPLPSWGLA